mgnify:CR=1 FL=1
MAILTGITGAVRANIAGAAQRAVKNVASGVKSAAGLDNVGSNSQLGQLTNLMGGSSSNILSYPLAVDTDPQQGHYVLFHINTRKNGKLVTPKSGKNMSEAVDKLQNELGAEGLDDGGEDSIESQAIAGTKIPKIEAARGNKNRSIVLSKLPTKRLEKSIALYMPPNVQVNYDVKYADKEIGALAMAGSAVIDKIKGNASTESVLRTALDGAEVKEGLTDFFNKALDTVASGAEALSQLERGSVITPRMEMMFEGVGRRSFSYTFAFIPKSEQEALVVEDIIQHFKFYAMPKYSNPTTRREMDIPGTFDIEYMYRGSRNNFLNRVHTCFLTQVQVQYGADRYTAYEETTGGRGKGSPPQKSQITLNFTELEVLSQDHIDEGY